MKEYAQRKLERLARHFGRVADAEVDFSKEAKRFGLDVTVCRITIHVDGRRTPVLSAHERGADPQAALDMALDKIDRQVVKLKEKIKIEKKRSTAAVVVGEDEEPAAELAGEPERVRLKLRPESLADAEAALDSGRPFYVFLDEMSGAVSVCYRRPDGGLTVIEPVVT